MRIAHVYLLLERKKYMSLLIGVGKNIISLLYCLIERRSGFLVIGEGQDPQMVSDSVSQYVCSVQYFEYLNSTSVWLFVGYKHI